MSVANGSGQLVVAVEQLINLVAIAMTRDMRTGEAIALLGRSTLSNAQIATIIGTTADTVRVERNRRKREAAKAPGRSSKKMGSGVEVRG